MTTLFTAIEGGTRLVDRPRHVLRVTAKSPLFGSALGRLQGAVDRGLWPNVVRVLGNPVGTPESAVAVLDVQPLATAGPATARDLAVRVGDAAGVDVLGVEDAGIPGVTTDATRNAAFDAAERQAASRTLAARLSAIGAESGAVVRWAAVGAIVLLALFAISRSSSSSWE